MKVERFEPYGIWETTEVVAYPQLEKSMLHVKKGGPRVKGLSGAVRVDAGQSTITIGGLEVFVSSIGLLDLWYTTHTRTHSTYAPHWY